MSLDSSKCLRARPEARESVAVGQFSPTGQHGVRFKYLRFLVLKGEQDFTVLEGFHGRGLHPPPRHHVLAPETVILHDPTPSTSSAMRHTPEAPKLPLLKGALRRTLMKAHAKRVDHPTQKLGPGEEDNKVIGRRILNILRGEAPVIENGAGQVLLGNNVWIKRRDWDVACNTERKLSLRMHMLVERVWGVRLCATFSVAGGVSPKTPDAAIKPAAPPGPMEAILGFYRAQIMLNSDDHTEAELNALVEKEGKGFIRSKFQNASKKLKRESAIVKERMIEAGGVLPS